MTVAIELAQRGIPSTVLEARDRIASRDGLFNVVPAFEDELQRLDPSGGLVAHLSRSTHSIRDNHVTGTRIDQAFGALTADVATANADMAAMLESARPGTEQGTRAWAKRGIGDLENDLRAYAAARYPGLIDLRFDTALDGVRTLANGVDAYTRGADGTRAVLRGAFLVNAKGSPIKAPTDITAPGAPFVDQPDRIKVGRPTDWIGVRYPAQADTRILRARDRDEAGVPRTTLVLEAPDRAWVWAQVGPGQLTAPPAEQLALVEQRADALGLPNCDPGPTARPVPIEVQLAVTPHPVTGRILNVGDANRTPYFSRGTGAASGVVHDAPRAADAIARALATGDADTPLRAYARDVLAANTQLMASSLDSVAQELDPNG
jgi:hypothetical protein